MTTTIICQKCDKETKIHEASILCKKCLHEFIDKKIASSSKETNYYRQQNRILEKENNALRHRIIRSTYMER